MPEAHSYTGARLRARACRTHVRFPVAASAARPTRPDHATRPVPERIAYCSPIGP
jgi:hypothetical protein